MHCAIAFNYKFSKWVKIFTVIASEAKQSQPLRSPSFRSATLCN
ncbi:hypothetical protein FDUTEX481_01198 [Tolypothrix sp. PCC 7601]|nr:hypothetical protein FDUTEX481_01198 [Tolypothrix sp. PCC 7601]